MLATAIVLIGLVYDAIHHPEISADSRADTSHPFATPFIVTNKSWLFSLGNAQLNCAVDIIRLKNFEFANGILVGSAATIPPNQPFGFRCGIAPGPGFNFFNVEPADVLAAHMHLYVTYKTLWFSRQSDPIEFTWYTAANPAHWIAGTLVP
jgi:hypothetical protein